MDQGVYRLSGNVNSRRVSAWNQIDGREQRHNHTDEKTRLRFLKECYYQKCECAKSTYPYKCDVKAFVAANDTFKSKLIRNMKI